MLDSIYIGMSGLTAHSKGLQTISNNVANLNTPGFKTTTPRFSDLYYGQRFFGEGPDSARITSAGSGVEYSYSSLNFKQGEIRKSDGQLDLGIEGSGFLALLDDKEVRYARTGQFVIKDDGTVREKNTDLQLTTIGADGTLVPVTVDKQRISPPKPTSSVKFAENLTIGQDKYSIPNVEVYDATGAKVVLTVDFEKDKTSPQSPGGGQRWNVIVKVKDQIIGRDEIRFLPGGAIEPGLEQFDITLKAEGGTTTSIKFDFDGVTNFSMGTTSTLKVSKVDGYAMGSLASLKVDDKGMLVINYSNGQTANIGTVALANFSDPQRLIQLGDGLFDASQLPPPNYVASKQGAGELSSGVTEASNVDLSTEFGRLILIQRGFQASSQVISTANEMIMQLFQMKSGQG
ncbi:MAG: flagellar hook protein FlgE [Lysobacter sp.]